MPNSTREIAAVFPHKKADAAEAHMSDAPASLNVLGNREPLAAAPSSDAGTVPAIRHGVLPPVPWAPPAPWRRSICPWAAYGLPTPRPSTSWHRAVLSFRQGNRGDVVALCRKADGTGTACLRGRCDNIRHFGHGIWHAAPGQQRGDDPASAHYAISSAMPPFLQNGRNSAAL
jgi:hypothetical protein